MTIILSIMIISNIIYTKVKKKLKIIIKYNKIQTVT